MNKINLFKLSTFLLSLSFLSLSGFNFALGAELNREYSVNLDQTAILKDSTVSAFEDQIKLSLTAGVLKEPTEVSLLELNEEMDMPWQLERLSHVYQFEFKNKSAYDKTKPLQIQLNYEKNTNNYKQIFFFDKTMNTWRPLPTKDFPDKKFVRSSIFLPFARVAVFNYPNILTTGKASWYAYKGGDYAASPDFPKGSRVRVYNTDNNKYIDVTINDWGPDRILHPDRPIDLDKKAFAKIASLKSGVINVRVEPLEIKNESNGRNLNIPSKGATTNPEITAKSFIAMKEGNGEVILGKNATTTMPLASLTKLVAIKVFLDTRPTLSNVISYSLKDEEYNYQYANKWELARLKLDDGDTLTIEDLLYSALVGSANNAVETLARSSGMLREDFIKKMNETVKSWGAQSTYFIEPTGLSPKNVSSALDYAIITKEVFKNPIIQKASTMNQYKFSTINTKKAHRIVNTNKLISQNRFNVTGSKTGYLDEAGYCLMTRAKAPNGEQIIAVLLNANSRDKSFLETQDLMNYAFLNL